jgi:hypothetical protein
MENLSNLSVEELKAKKKTLTAQDSAVYLLGSVLGVIYSQKTGGGLLRGIGYLVAGSIVVGIIPRYFYFLPKQKEIDELIKQKEILTQIK